VNLVNLLDIAAMAFTVLFVKVIIMSVQILVFPHAVMLMQVSLMVGGVFPIGQKLVRVFVVMDPFIPAEIAVMIMIV